MNVYATSCEDLDPDRAAIEVQGEEGDLYTVWVARGPAWEVLARLDAGHTPEALDLPEWLLHPWRVA